MIAQGGLLGFPPLGRDLNAAPQERERSALNRVLYGWRGAQRSTHFSGGQVEGRYGLTDRFCVERGGEGQDLIFDVDVIHIRFRRIG